MADGSQEVPTSVEDVGWWKHGSPPAGAGSAVLVGHAYSRGDGVFDDLERLQAGDTIMVSGTTGTADFVVEQTTTVPVQQFEDVADDIYRTAGQPQLIVMTCGDFDGSDYQSTVIVRARLAA
jgi:LPXTG-site transpeptidase (sortase) family protein